jgi:hypothetical protein
MSISVSERSIAAVDGATGESPTALDDDFGRAGAIAAGRFAAAGSAESG